MLGRPLTGWRAGANDNLRHHTRHAARFPDGGLRLPARRARQSSWRLPLRCPVPPESDTRAALSSRPAGYSLAIQLDKNFAGTPARYFPAIERTEREAIISMFIMSRGRHEPPGQGSGKFVAVVSADGMPRELAFMSCSRVMSWASSIFALAASERMPIEL